MHFIRMRGNVFGEFPEHRFAHNLRLLVRNRIAEALIETQRMATRTVLHIIHRCHVASVRNMRIKRCLHRLIRWIGRHTVRQTATNARRLMAIRTLHLDVRSFRPLEILL